MEGYKNDIVITDLGVIPGAEELQTEAFQRALDKIFLLGGGRLTVPAGKYRIGGVRVRSNTTLYLASGAEIYGSRDPEDYHCIAGDSLEPLPSELQTDVLWTRAGTPGRDFSFILKAGSRWNNAIFRAVHGENISIIGEKGSVIDGCNPYDPIGEEHYRGPHGINMHYCKNIRFEGYTIRNTGDWAHCIQFSEGLSWKNITVEGGHDGIHNRSCHGITVEDCEFYVGDDCIAGFANYDITVRGCIMNTACSGLRIGGADILVENCRFYGPAKYLFRGSLSKEEKISGAMSSAAGRNNMLSMFTYYADKSMKIPKQPENIVIRNCTAENCDRLIHYNFSGNETWQLGAPLKSLTLENIDARGVRLPLTAYGDGELPLELTMKDVSVSFNEESDCTFLQMAHVSRLSLENVAVDRTGGEPFIKCWSDIGETVFENVEDRSGARLEVTLTDEVFKCRAI